MPDLLTNSGAATLFHGVSAEARAALVTTLAKQQAKRTCMLLVTDPRRASRRPRWAPSIVKKTLQALPVERKR